MACSISLQPSTKVPLEQEATLALPRMTMSEFHKKEIQNLLAKI